MDEAERNAAIEDYKLNFSGYMADVFDFSGAAGDTVGMLGASFYVLRLGGAKIAVDPYIKLELLPGLSLDTVISAFKHLDGVLLTHEHRDHYDRTLMTILRDLPLKWYIPRFFGHERLANTTLPADKIEFIDAGASFCIKDIIITPFDSPHSDPQRNTVTNEYGYFFETPDKNILFPVDVRVYDPDLLPRFGKIDILFQHVWFGSGEALNLPCEPKLTEMCAFAAAFKPAKIYLGHLYEFDRGPDSMWTDRHAALADKRIKKLLPEMEVETLRIGKVYKI